MSFTVGDVLLEVREQMLDAKLPYRYTDEFIVRKINQTLRRAAIKRPDLFVKFAPLACAAGILQSCPTDSIRLMDVVNDAAGNALKEINQDTLDLTASAWGTSAEAVPINWMRFARDPNRFYVYPPALASTVLNIVYAASPAKLVSSDAVPLPDAYEPAIIDGTMWLAESQDAEHVESGRAKQFMDSFNEQLSAGLMARALTDADGAGQPEKKVT